MISQIHLQQVVPFFLEDVPADQVHSEVWRSDLLFEKGQAYLVRADSGKGKTTLCNFIYGLRKDYTGKITFDGNDIRKFSHRQWSQLRRESFSSVFQGMLLFDELTALENIHLKPMASGMSDEDVIRCFDRLGLSEKVHSRVKRLSFGQKQRVAFIRMLCQAADFLIMDEPVSHLDDTNSGIMADMLHERIAKDGAGLIVTSIGRDLPYDYNRIVHL